MKSRYFLVLTSVLILASCRPLTTERTAPESDTQGLIGKGLSSALFPPAPKPAGSLVKIGKSMARLGTILPAMTSPIGQFRGSLFSGIISAGGIPRAQIKGLLEDILSSKAAACGGISCGQIFGISPGEIDIQLDAALADVQKSPRLAQPDMAEKKSLLIRSLERRPGWLNPEDFGPPLPPRKAYDLTAEIATFKSCTTCSISADENTIRRMIAGARQGDHFVWALRPDGRLVVGRGPDEKMSHGVLASIDLLHVDQTGRETLPALASGEGYVDPIQKALLLNNKSGHYRPEFKRVNNPSIRRLFEALLPSSASEIKFVDQTKPR